MKVELKVLHLRKKLDEKVNNIIEHAKKIKNSMPSMDEISIHIDKLRKLTL